LKKNELPEQVRQAISAGTVIPAIPLALNRNREYDPRRQRALIRYYIDAGAGGIAVGVHTTQFEIRDAKYRLFEPVLSTVSGMIDDSAGRRGRTVVKIGGICGRTDQALREARFLTDHGFHAGLLSMSALAQDPADVLVEHAKAVAAVLPIFGFYLQPSVGGRILPYEFWERFAAIDNVIGIKIAPFNRYHTLDVVRAVCAAGREKEIALYTGNDDHILLDLLTEYRIRTPRAEQPVRIVGGLLGQWSVWTKKAVEQHEEARRISLAGDPVPQRLLTRAEELTDANAVIFDAAHGFAGCIPGIHEILRRQGLLEGTWCLDPEEVLSPGQGKEIDRICRSYPHLTDDDFVKANLPEWLA
jgi:dihydrodipicolinate synthase/N-acetylneuraminate lyase